MHGLAAGSGNRGWRHPIMGTGSKQGDCVRRRTLFQLGKGILFATQFRTASCSSHVRSQPPAPSSEELGREKPRGEAGQGLETWDGDQEKLGSSASSSAVPRVRRPSPAPRPPEYHHRLAAATLSPTAARSASPPDGRRIQEDEGSGRRDPKRWPHRDGRGRGGEEGAEEGGQRANRVCGVEGVRKSSRNSTPVRGGAGRGDGGGEAGPSFAVARFPAPSSACSEETGVRVDRPQPLGAPCPASSRHTPLRNAFDRLDAALSGRDLGLAPRAPPPVWQRDRW
ncbi:uncharacterized protein PSFLO_06704 [Pseudozyma flocculosa]|uniref:Uncharacterized protein n=1 Tax=Pseudozyma flocculosa TaxID=84751 RepID=A0A5C3F9X6_9BASI|nr:uncharacterized protein PSFLO_06704 [Pseudozyma flocculosa]